MLVGGLKSSDELMDMYIDLVNKYPVAIKPYKAEVPREGTVKG